MPNANALSTESSAPDWDAAQSILSDAFGHFRANLDLLQKSNDPEVVHQARVGWRRFKSAVHLFKPLLQKDGIPANATLQPVLKTLSRLRDLDVARFQTLPELSSVYMDGTAPRAREWERLRRIFADADRKQRLAILANLQDPDVQSTLENTSQWIAGLVSCGALSVSRGVANGEFRSWAKHRIRQMHKKLKVTKINSDTAQSQHRTRILAKRLRYSIEALSDVLPRKMARDWYLEASELQTRIGRTRDILRASTLAVELKVPKDIAQHLKDIASDLAQQE